ncbi:N-acetylmuramoyl-L-alanine amidase AmiD-like [Adelges cooleyi]|uniref:N-acetylmuramoyl-L-alanine amidase AmiD-like n=1 Tax=Adelges cooleyi TaxID=133065 RepID=UPI0021808BE7|nr:N-acetylmuramoyl-L-alanine amidase AmiD-like [Adelges cooleyi]
MEPNFLIGANPMPLYKAFPGEFKPDAGINVTGSTIRGIEGSYTIDPFPVAQTKRNHYDSRHGAKIKYLIMHYTVINFALTVQTFTANADTRRVSAHFVVAQNEAHVAAGKLLQVVPEDMRAWHAGLSAWQADEDLNPVSLAVEHVNQGFRETTGAQRQYYPYDQNQIRSSGVLSNSIVRQYNILPRHVLGHEDIAPGRKYDPGPYFPWAVFYHNYSVGAWLDQEEMDKDAIIRKYRPQRPYPLQPDRDVLLDMLTSYGYSLRGTTPSGVIRAFKTHFSANQRPDMCDDNVREEDMFWAWALEAKYSNITPSKTTPSPPSHIPNFAQKAPHKMWFLILAIQAIIRISNL